MYECKFINTYINIYVCTHTCRYLYSIKHLHIYNKYVHAYL